MSQTQACLEDVPGVEIYKATPDGHIITVVERESNAELADVLQQLQNTTGVLSASLVYHYSDKSDATDEEIES